MWKFLSNLFKKVEPFKTQTNYSRNNSNKKSFGEMEIEGMGVKLQRMLQSKFGCNTIYYYYDWKTARERVDMSLPLLLQYHSLSIEELKNTDLSTYIITVGVEIDDDEYIVNNRNSSINTYQFENFLNVQVERETVSVSNKEQGGKLYKLYKFLVQI